MGNKQPKNSRGRPKGSPNKHTASIKGAFVEAFEKLGGVDALVVWGYVNPNDFYKLCARMIPTEMTGTVDFRDVTKLSDQELDAERRKLKLVS